MISEHSLVVLVDDLPAEGLLAGDAGAVVQIYGEGEAFEIEFVDGGGGTIALLTLKRDAVRELAPGEVLHARPHAEHLPQYLT